MLVTINAKGNTAAEGKKRKKILKENLIPYKMGFYNCVLYPTNDPLFIVKLITIYENIIFTDNDYNP